jgi:hypothetical protein
MTMVSYFKLKATVLVLILMSMMSTSDAACAQGLWFWCGGDMFLMLFMFLLLLDMVKATDGSDGIKLPVFSPGVKFMVWWVRFESYARIKKFWKVLVKAEPRYWPDDPNALASDAMVKAAQEELIDHNNKAVYYFGMAFDTEKLINILRDAKNITTEYPQGIAWKIVKDLFRIFQPRDIMSEVYMKRCLDALTWKPDESPDAFDSKVISIRNECTDERDERTELACLISKAPEIYQAAISTEARRFVRDGSVIEYSDALDVCRDIYCQVHGLSGLVPTKDKEKEVQLYTQEKGEITCYKCLQKGHPVTKCTNDPSADAKKCTECGLWGHDESKCWEKEENANRRPQGWKSRQGVSALNMDKVVIL